MEKITKIESQEEYRAALSRLDMIFDASPGTPEGEELEFLGALIDKFELAHYPMD